MGKKTVRYWGQEATIDIANDGSDVWITSIRKTHYEKGKPASIGLNERFLEEAVKADATLAIRIESLKRRIFVNAKKFKEDSWVHEHPSKVKPGTTFKIYMHPVKRYFLR